MNTTFFFISTFIFLRRERQVWVEGMHVSTLGEISHHVLAPRDPIILADIVAARMASLDGIEVDGLVPRKNATEHFICSSSASRETPSAQVNSSFLQLHGQR